MRLASIFSVAMLCLSFARPFFAAEFGVGFSLSLDYGVSSIYYANGSSVGVAKIEGSPAYKSFMRAQGWGNQTSALDSAQHSMSLQQKPLGFNPDFLRDYLPGWLGGGHSDESVVALSPMLQGLKAATESYTGSKISYVNVAIPLRGTDSFADILSAAVSRASLKQDDAYQLDAGIWGVHANQWVDPLDVDCEEPPRLVLSLDYSRAALTAMVMEEECGAVDRFANFHDRTVGTDNWSDRSSATLVQELRRLISDATVEIGHEVPISKIVLLGESGKDERLQHVMRDVLLRKDAVYPGVPFVMHTNANDLLEPIDPLFASAVGVASRAWLHLEDEERGHSCQLPVDPRYMSRSVDTQETDGSTM